MTIARAALAALCLTAIALALPVGVSDFFLRTEAAPTTGSREPAAWPFDARSPWNMPIGSGAVYNTIAGDKRDWAQTANTYIEAGQWTVAVYKASSSDPLVNVSITSTTGDAPMSFLQPDPTAGDFCSPTSTTAGTTYQIRSPSNAVPSPPTVGDGHLAIASPDGTHVWEFYGAWKYDGVNFKASRFFKNLIQGDGWSGYRCYHAPRASGASALGGLIRAGELTNGIKHALAVTIDNKQFNKNGPNGKSWIWPAVMSDPPDPYGTTGNVYMGSLLAIPASVNLEAINWNTVQGKNIAKALQLYGVYVVDGMNEGGPHFVPRMEYTARSELPNEDPGTPFRLDLQQARSLLKVVVNNGPTRIGGGGTPLAPLAPPFVLEPRR